MILEDRFIRIHKQYTLLAGGWRDAGGGGGGGGAREGLREGKISEWFMTLFLSFCLHLSYSQIRNVYKHILLDSSHLFPCVQNYVT